jgi:CDP-glycerol glycerophosphotransferase
VPVVSVVVIGYNDAANLATALRSATRQTLRDLEIVVVDDASTDDTPAVAARFAARDPRVRVIRLERNSGGCSRPRNTGVDAATGRWVTFLDSDDVLTPRACERLVRAAERADADMACGRYVRRHLHPRRHLAAHDELYLRPTVLESVLDRPQQLRDTPCCSKLYARRFLTERGLRFPEGLLFEDLLFTTQAYCTARRIAVVPDLVYVWNVRRDAAAPSITNRIDVRNWADRFEVHRRIDAFLDDQRVASRLRVAKDRKFLDVDLHLFLRQLREFAPSVRGELVDLAGAYVRSLDLSAQAAADPAARVGAFLIRDGDLDAVLAAADWAATGEIGVPLSLADGRLWWAPPAATQADARDALDITGTGLGSVGFAATPFLVTVDAAELAQRRLELRGVVHDVLGRLGPAAEARVSVEVSGRVGGALWRGAACVDEDDAGRRFRTSVDLAAVGRRMTRPSVGHELRL